MVVVEIDGPVKPLAPPRDLAQGRPVAASAEWLDRPTLAKELAVDGNVATVARKSSRDGWLAVDLGWVAGGDLGAPE